MPPVCTHWSVLALESDRPCPLQVLSRLASLQSLTLMGCSMSSLPPSLSALTNLRVLYLGALVTWHHAAACWAERRCGTTLPPLAL